MGRNKMIAKGCPECEQQVPVACKACPCGYSFFNAKRAQQSQLCVVDDVVRRTQRVRREKPDYYDSLQYDKRLKRARARNSECDVDEDGGKRDPSKAKRRRLKREEEEGEDMMNNLSAERQLQCSLILEELNRKLRIVTWKPPDD